MTDQYVQVPVDSTGKKIDTSEMTNAAGNVVERQRVVLGDPNIPGNLQNVTVDGEAWMGGPHFIDFMTAIVVELRIANLYLQMIANSQDDPAALRTDPSLQP